MTERQQKFNTGDLVRPLPGHYTGYTPGSPYNLPRGVAVVTESAHGYIKVVTIGGVASPALNPESFEFAAKEARLFKAGDRVRVKDADMTRLIAGEVYTAQEGTTGEYVQLLVGGQKGGYRHDRFEPVDGPVRMRPAIVPGTYGVVSIKDKYPGSVNDNVVNVCIQPTHATSAELTAAIATLTTIRDALDEVA